MKPDAVVKEIRTVRGKFAQRIAFALTLLTLGQLVVPVVMKRVKPFVDGTYAFGEEKKEKLKSTLERGAPPNIFTVKDGDWEVTFTNYSSCKLFTTIAFHKYLYN